MTDNSMRERSRRTLSAAPRNYEQNPTLANTVWYGRVLGIRYQYEGAIRVFSKGLEPYSDSFELYRQRSHRFIYTRRFTEALSDLEQAARLIEGIPLWIEPDGVDNELPVSPAGEHPV